MVPWRTHLNLLCHRTYMWNGDDTELPPQHDQEGKKGDQLDDEITEEDEDFDSQSSEDDEFRDFIDDTEVNKRRVVTDDMDDEQARIALEKEQERVKKLNKRKKRMQKLKARTMGVSVTAAKDLRDLWLDADDLLAEFENVKITRLESGGALARSTKDDVEQTIDPAICVI